MDVESCLRIYFTLAAKWDAILLLDEADLFLEQRKSGDVHCNSLSIIFLRTMEYYKGVLFLTTNRPGHIDDSFISRITCPIKYDALTDEAKKKMAQKFVKKFEETGTISVEMRAKQYLQQNCQDLNGRQIRNVLQNAVASAEISQRSQRRYEAPHGYGSGRGKDGPVVVKMHHVKAVVERQTGFREYLDNLRGKDEAARAMGKRDYLAVPPRSPRY
jgi:SpoVK/Ycf46/Vps4 family AAA+-type ATPase